MTPPDNGDNIKQLVLRETVLLKEQIEDRERRMSRYKKLFEDKEEIVMLLQSEVASLKAVI